MTRQFLREADEPSQVYVYISDAQQPCDYARGSGPYAMVSVPAGPFSITENIQNSAGQALGAQPVVCGAIYGQTGQPVATTSTPVGSELPKKTISANTNNQLDTFPGVSWRGGLSIWSMTCGDPVTNQCDMQGTGAINVSDSTRKKLGLPHQDRGDADDRRDDAEGEARRPAQRELVDGPDAGEQHGGEHEVERRRGRRPRLEGRRFDADIGVRRQVAPRDRREVLAEFDRRDAIPALSHR